MDEDSEQSMLKSSVVVFVQSYLNKIEANQTGI